MTDKKKPGRPLMDDLPRVPMNDLVKPSTKELLDAWGKPPGLSRGIVLDKLVHAEGERQKEANRQAAKAYDMDIKDVESIRKLYPNQFYEMLEEFIEHRAEMDNKVKG